MSGLASAETVDLAGHRVALEEVRRTFDKAWDSVDAVDLKLQALLSAAGLLIAIAATLQVTILKTAAGTLFWVALLAALVVFAALFAVVLWGVWPRTIALTTASSWKHLDDRYFNLPEHEVLRRVIFDNLYVIDGICKLTYHKSLCLRLAMGLFLAMVVALLVALRLSMS